MKDLNYYLSLKYPIELVETDEGFVSSHPDLPGCASFGDTAAEAIDSLNEVRELWLQGQVEAHGSAPEPRQPEDFSGRFVIRLPKWLHRVLDSEAKNQACSLNSLVVSLLSLGIGASSRTPVARPHLPENWTTLHEWQTEWEGRTSGHWSINRFLRLQHSRDRYVVMLGKIARQRKATASSRKAQSEYGESKNVTETEESWQN